MAFRHNQLPNRVPSSSVSCSKNAGPSPRKLRPREIRHLRRAFLGGSLKRIPLIVMWLVVILEAFWFFMLLFFFRPKSFPVGVVLVFATWVALVISLYLFIRNVPRTALTVAYIAVLASTVIFIIGAGTSFSFDSLRKDAPNLIFLVAAHFAYRGLQRRSVS